MAASEKVIRISLDADASIGIYTGPPGLPGSADPNYGKAGCFVKVTGEHTAGLCTAASNELPVGVLENKPQHVGDAASIATGGVTLIQAGTGGLTAGQAVKSDANGKGVAATVGTDRVLAVCVRSAAAGSLAMCLLQLGN
jgi:hypothetical protein